MAAVGAEHMVQKVVTNGSTWKLPVVRVIGWYFQVEVEDVLCSNNMWLIIPANGVLASRRRHYMKAANVAASSMRSVAG